MNARRRLQASLRRNALNPALASVASFDQLEPRLAFAVTYAATNDWGSGLEGQLTIQNDTAAMVNDWQVTFDYGRAINSIWNAVIVSHVGTHSVIRNAAWNGTIAAGAEISFGFQTDGVAGELPTAKKVDGIAVA